MHEGYLPTPPPLFLDFFLARQEVFWGNRNPTGCRRIDPYSLQSSVRIRVGSVRSPRHHVTEVSSVRHVCTFGPIRHFFFLCIVFFNGYV